MVGTKVNNGTVIEAEGRKTVGSSHTDSLGHCKDFDFSSEGDGKPLWWVQGNGLS